MSLLVFNKAIKDIFLSFCLFTYIPQCIEYDSEYGPLAENLKQYP